MSDQGHTIADAARALGIGERRLRRLLARPEYAARTLTVERLTRTGTRQSVTVPADLFEEIRQRVEIEENAANVDSIPDTDKRGQPAEAGQQRGATLTRTEGMLAQLLAARERDVEYFKTELAKATETIQQQAATIATLTSNAAKVDSVSVGPDPPETPPQGAPVPQSEPLAPEAGKSASEPEPKEKSPRRKIREWLAGIAGWFWEPKDRD